MKKLIALILVICVLFAGAVSWNSIKNMQASSGAGSYDLGGDVYEMPDVSKYVPDIDAIYNSHSPDEVVLTVNGSEITWDEYFYYYYNIASQLTQYIQSYAYYGMDADWDMILDEETGETCAQAPAKYGEEQLKQNEAILTFADQNNIEINEEAQQQIDAQLLADIQSCCGETGTEEDFNAFLEENYLNRRVYDKLNECSALYTCSGEELYGEAGEKLPAEEAVAYLEENGYMRSDHILLSTLNAETGEELNDEEKAEKLAQAEEIAAELAAMEDSEERYARFLEIRDEVSDDPGKVSYPGGYTFIEGDMVESYSTATKNCEEWQVTEVVESEYGYHIIMRLPLDPSLEITNAGTSGSVLAANDILNASIDKIVDSLKIEYVNGFKAPNIKDYLP